MGSEAQASSISIDAGGVRLDADLRVPPASRGCVLFAHGSGSSRQSPRNRYVAGVLQQAHLATLLLDLLTTSEEAVDRQTAELRFDIPLLAARLIGATDWVTSRPELQHLAVGYFGASTGSAAALMAAAERSDIVKAIVSRGGRPDLAGSALSRVWAPTLLIVGSLDFPVIEMNREAIKLLRGDKRLEIIPGATHLFEEVGTLEEVARRARDWFEQYLTSSHSS